MPSEHEPPRQWTSKGTVIPIPTREQVTNGLKKIAKPITKLSNQSSLQK